MEKKILYIEKKEKLFSLRSALCCEAQKLKQKSGREIYVVVVGRRRRRRERWWEKARSINARWLAVLGGDECNFPDAILLSCAATASSAFLVKKGKRKSVSSRKPHNIRMKITVIRAVRWKCAH